MSQTDNFLHTTHRTVTWFQKTFKREELILRPPFQRNLVWTLNQKAYLIDSVLNGYPVPELYMQDAVDSVGTEQHIVVDGQQRIKACLEFLENGFSLEGDAIHQRWRGRSFDSLSPTEKQDLYAYKFVVRILPSGMSEEELRGIFSRLNRNVVALNAQELRNATYWGEFISTMQEIAEHDFWSESGLFSANDHRRMLDHEYISELAVAFLLGPQNKKDQLDNCFLRYEESFDAKKRVTKTFFKTIDEIDSLIPGINKTRWKKKSDFYTLFLCIATRAAQLPFSSDQRDQISAKLFAFGLEIDALLNFPELETTRAPAELLKYARNVSRAASDKASRIARTEALEQVLFPDEL